MEKKKIVSSVRAITLVCLQAPGISLCDASRNGKGCGKKRTKEPAVTFKLQFE